MRPGIGPDIWWRTPATVRSAMMLARGRASDAVQLIDAELRRLGHPDAQPSLALSAALRDAARIYAAAGDSRLLDVARSAAKVAEQMARSAARSADVGEALLLLAQAQRQAGQLDAARVTARRAVNCLTNGLDAAHPLTLEAHSVLPVTATEIAPVPPVANGLPAIAVSAPVVGSIANAATAFES
jgi:ATP/maltotriose-dependent transcriptional regulator MalT